MARFYAILAIIGVAVAFAEACTSSSGRMPAWDIGDNVEIYPTFDAEREAVGVEVSIRFRRGADEAAERVFNLIDRFGDGLIDVSEWTTEGGSVINFVELLNAADQNGDEKISWDEFPKANEANKA